MTCHFRRTEYLENSDIIKIRTLDPVEVSSAQIRRNIKPFHLNYAFDTEKLGWRRQEIQVSEQISVIMEKPFVIRMLDICIKNFPDTRSQNGMKMTFGKRHFNFLG